MFRKEGFFRKKTHVREGDMVNGAHVSLLTISEPLLQALESGNRQPLLERIREELQSLGLDESQLVFRGITQPNNTIVAKLIQKYGTDRFVGFNSANLPLKDEGLVPFRNSDEKGILTADTYAVPELDWSLGHTSLGIASTVDDFRKAKFANFLILYDRSCVKTTRTPERGGELWSATFLTEPRDALKGLIQLLSPNTPEQVL